MAKSNNGSPSDNYIIEGSEINGNLKSASNIKIEGKIFGNVSCVQRLILGKSGYVKGDILCKDAILEGEVEGALKVSDCLELRKGSKINGNIVASRIILDENCSIIGKMKLKNKNDSF